MKLHELKPVPGSTHSKKRVGRGESSGWGKTSGRGHKGQNSRSGGGTRPGFEGGQMPLHRRLPKRGFKNPFRIEHTIINISQLEQRFENGDKVTPEVLLAMGMIRKKMPLKILGFGELKKKLEVSAQKFSRKATEAIEAAGGKAIVIEAVRSTTKEGEAEESE
jgi:large subunit ribosomal protein L15